MWLMKKRKTTTAKHNTFHRIIELEGISPFLKMNFSFSSTGTRNITCCRSVIPNHINTCGGVGNGSNAMPRIKLLPGVGVSIYLGMLVIRGAWSPVDAPAGLLISLVDGRLQSETISCLHNLKLEVVSDCDFQLAGDLVGPAEASVEFLNTQRSVLAKVSGNPIHIMSLPFRNPTLLPKGVDTAASHAFFVGHNPSVWEQLF